MHLILSDTPTHVRYSASQDFALQRHTTHCIALVILRHQLSTLIMPGNLSGYTLQIEIGYKRL